MFGTGLVILYNGDIEFTIIRPKRGDVKIKRMNIFCSKKERKVAIDTVKTVDIVLKGKVERSSDTSSYWIRLTMENGEKVEFGQSVVFKTISEKVDM